MRRAAQWDRTSHHEAISIGRRGQLSEQTAAEVRDSNRTPITAALLGLGWCSLRSVRGSSSADLVPKKKHTPVVMPVGGREHQDNLPGELLAMRFLCVVLLWVPLSTAGDNSETNRLGTDSWTSNLPADCFVEIRIATEGELSENQCGFYALYLAKVIAGRESSRNGPPITIPLVYRRVDDPARQPALTKPARLS